MWYVRGGFIKKNYVKNDMCIFDDLRDKYEGFKNFYGNSDIENLVREVEDILGLHGKVFEIGQALNKTGFRIFRAELDDDTSGVFACDKGFEKYLGAGKKKVVLLNKNKSLENQRFTMAHELGHYIFDYEHKEYFSKHGSEEADTPKEKRASRFAAALLMKKDEFKDSFEALKIMGYDPKSIVESLAKEYCVPQTAVARRIEELKLR